MPPQVPPPPNLPAYTARQPASRPDARVPALHTYALNDGKGRPWLTLNMSSRAPSSVCLPQFYEGDSIRGSVSLRLEKESQVKTVTITVS